MRGCRSLLLSNFQRGLYRQAVQGYQAAQQARKQAQASDYGQKTKAIRSLPCCTSCVHLRRAMRTRHQT